MNTQDIAVTGKEEYFMFMKLGTDEEALEFIKARTPDPVGKSYFTPTDFRWATMEVRARLVREYNKRWKSLWALFNLKHKIPEQELFEYQEQLVIKALVEWKYLSHCVEWVESRYDIPSNSYLRPDAFSMFKQEANNYITCIKNEPSGYEDSISETRARGWDLEDTFEVTMKGKEKGIYEDSDIRYYWKKVYPHQEDLTDERRHVILMDLNTKQEAPLLQGMKPYQD